MHVDKVLSSEMAYRGRVIQLRVDELLMDSGRAVKREVVLHPDSVSVLALTAADDKLLLVNQYRRPPDRLMWEIPAGKIDAGETPQQAIHRELLEECNMVADQMTLLASFYPSPGILAERMHLFVARGCRPGDGSAVMVGEIAECKAVTLAEAEAMVAGGDIQDAKSMLAIAHWKQLSANC